MKWSSPGEKGAKGREERDWEVISRVYGGKKPYA